MEARAHYKQFSWLCFTQTSAERPSHSFIVVAVGRTSLVTGRTFPVASSTCHSSTCHSSSSRHVRTQSCSFPTSPIWIEERYLIHQALENHRLNSEISHKSQISQERNRTHPFSINLILWNQLSRNPSVFSLARQHYKEERHKLSAGDSLKMTSSLLSLNPTLGTGRHLAVGGRLGNFALRLTQRHPIILSGKDKLTSLIVMSMHLSLLHSGPTLLSTLGTTYHITGAKRLIRTICQRCYLSQEGSQHGATTHGTTPSTMGDTQRCLQSNRNRLCWAISRKERSN